MKPKRWAAAVGLLSVVVVATPAGALLSVDAQTGGFWTNDGTRDIFWFWASYDVVVMPEGAKCFMRAAGHISDASGLVHSHQDARGSCVFTNRVEAHDYNAWQENSGKTNYIRRGDVWALGCLSVRPDGCDAEMGGVPQPPDVTSIKRITNGEAPPLA